MSIKTFIPSGFPGEREIIIPADLLDSIINNPVTEQLYVTHIGYYPNVIIGNDLTEQNNTYLYIVKTELVG